MPNCVSMHVRAQLFVLAFAGFSWCVLPSVLPSFLPSVLPSFLLPFFVAWSNRTLGSPEVFFLKPVQNEHLHFICRVVLAWIWERFRVGRITRGVRFETRSKRTPVAKALLILQVLSPKISVNKLWPRTFVNKPWHITSVDKSDVCKIKPSHEQFNLTILVAQNLVVAENLC